MRRKKGADQNMKFLFASVFLFFILIIIIVLFSYFTLRVSSNGNKMEKWDYEITFSPDFSGHFYDVYLNDTLVYVGNPIDVDSLLHLCSNQKENSLLIVEQRSQDVTVIELKSRGRVMLKIKDSVISVGD